LNEMKVGDILGVKTYSDPSYIFSGGQQPQLPGSTPLSLPQAIRPTPPMPVNCSYDVASMACVCMRAVN